MAKQPYVRSEFPPSSSERESTLWTPRTRRNALQVIGLTVGGIGLVSCGLLPSGESPVAVDWPTSSPAGKKIERAPNGLLATYMLTSQFESGTSPDNCSGYATAFSAFATPPNVPNNADPKKIAAFADGLYLKYYGKDVPTNETVEKIAFENQYEKIWHGMLQTDARIPALGIPKIAYKSFNGPTAEYKPPERRAKDMALIVKAARYFPLMISLSMDSVWDKELQGNPYNQNTEGVYHIFTIGGIDENGDLLVLDSANFNPQTNRVRDWPRTYRTADINPQWALILQMNWSPPIPNDDPSTWPPLAFSDSAAET